MIHPDNNNATTSLPGRWSVPREAPDRTSWCPRLPRTQAFFIIPDDRPAAFHLPLCNLWVSRITLCGCPGLRPGLRRISLAAVQLVGVPDYDDHPAAFYLPLCNFWVSWIVAEKGRSNRLAPTFHGCPNLLRWFSSVFWNRKGAASFDAAL